jgi:uncharacterized protein
MAEFIVEGRMNRQSFWKIVSAVELFVAAIVIILDLFIPTLAILGIMCLSLAIRREGYATIGFKKSKNALGMILAILTAVIIWSLLQLGLFMPVLNHLTGTVQDVSAFDKLRGNLGSLIFFLAMTWTLAAFGEEIVYRGYLQQKVSDLFGNSSLAAILAIGISSILFGFAHTEQGTIGVVVTTLDAIFFSGLKRRYANNLWAPVLAHGMSNTIGLTAYYFVGPITGFW